MRAMPTQREAAANLLGLPPALPPPLSPLVAINHQPSPVVRLSSGSGYKKWAKRSTPQQRDDLAYVGLRPGEEDVDRHDKVVGRILDQELGPAGRGRPQGDGGEEVADELVGGNEYR